MEKYYYNSENGLWYELQGDYYILRLTLGEEDKRLLRKWRRKHLRHLKEHFLVPRYSNNTNFTKNLPFSIYAAIDRQ